MCFQLWQLIFYSTGLLYALCNWIIRAKCQDYFIHSSYFDGTQMAPKQYDISLIYANSSMANIYSRAEGEREVFLQLLLFSRLHWNFTYFWPVLHLRQNLYAAESKVGIQNCTGTRELYTNVTKYTLSSLWEQQQQKQKKQRRRRRGRI